jgi:hypothetical protein
MEGQEVLRIEVKRVIWGHHRRNQLPVLVDVLPANSRQWHWMPAGAQTPESILNILKFVLVRI